VSLGKKEKIDFTGKYFQSDIFNKPKALESLVPKYEYTVDRLDRYITTETLGNREINRKTAYEDIDLLDEYLYLRRTIKVLITTIKENMSRIFIPESKNNINTIVNALYEVVINKDIMLRFRHE
jgi:hypothetical protein